MKMNLQKINNRLRTWHKAFVVWHNKVFSSRSARGVVFSCMLIVAIVMMVEWKWISGDSGQILGNALGIVAAVLASQWIAELNQKQNAKNAAAPILAELREYHKLAIEIWRKNQLTIKELKARNDSRVSVLLDELPRAQKDAFESLRDRLGELGAFLSQEITSLYTFLPTGKPAMAYGFNSGEELCNSQRTDIAKIENIIDLLFALERTGHTDNEALVEEAGAHPAQLSDRTNYPKKS